MVNNDGPGPKHQKAALAKAQADAAAKQAELQAQIAREKARAEAERQAALKRQEELVLRTKRATLGYHCSGVNLWHTTT
jgi:hypothetical protein